MSDILATASLTAGAAIVVACYALLFATTIAERWIIAAAMLTWFAVEVRREQKTRSVPTRIDVTQ